MPRQDDLRRLVNDLERAAEEIDEKARKAIERSGGRARRGWREKVRDRRSTPSHVPWIDRAVTSDVERIPGGWETEVGYDREAMGMAGRQAGLGHFLEWSMEYGGATRHPGMEGYRTMTEEEPRLVRDLEDAADPDL